MRASLVGLALLFLAACGGSSSDTTGPSGGPNLNGTYDLTTVDNTKPPVAFADSTLQGGSLVVSDSGWSQATAVLYKAGGSAGGDTLKLAGFWSGSGSSLILYDFGINTQYTGTFTSTGITLTTKTGTVLGYSKK